MPQVDKIAGHKSSMVADQLASSPKAIDRKDPNWDSDDEDEDVVWVEMDLSEKFENKKSSETSTYTGERRQMKQPEMTWDEFEKAAMGIFDECVSSGDVAEGTAALKQLGGAKHYDSFIVSAILRACEGTRENEEICSSWLTVLYDSHVLTRQHLGRAFEKLISRADDFTLDRPGFRESLVFFIQCAVEDGCLPRTFWYHLPQEFYESYLSTTSLQHGSVDAKLELQQYLEQLRSFKRSCKEEVQEYHQGGIPDGIMDLLRSPDAIPAVHELVKCLVRESFALTDLHRERTSVLLEQLSTDRNAGVSPDAVDLAFTRLLAGLEDIKLDEPNASELLLNFILRSVVDEILPPAFIQNHLRLKTGGYIGMAVTRKALRLLTDSKEMLTARFRKIWQCVDPCSQEGMQFRQELRNTLLEYFESGDREEVLRCCKEMALVPSQCSELVRKCFAFALDRDEPSRAIETMLELIEYLVERKILHHDDVAKGIKDAKAGLDEITIDVPDAPAAFKLFSEELRRRNLDETPAKLSI